MLSYLARIYEQQTEPSIVIPFLFYHGKQGKQEGREEGIEQGIEQGLLKGTQELLIKQLEQ